MTISNVGLTRITNLVTADLNDGKAGTGTTLPAVTDTDLQTAVSATEANVTVVAGSQSFSVTHIVSSTVGNGSSLTEWQIRMNSETTQLHRVVTAAVAKTSSIEITKITLFDVAGE